MTSADAKLRALFGGYEALYQTRSGLDPVDVLHRLQSREVRETLLCREVDGALEVALALGEQTLAHLEGRSLEHALSDAGLSEALPVLEGLSHLAYVCEAARCDRPISGLELETQAEVDKLAVVLLHRWPTDTACFDRLLDRLYFRFSWAPGATGLRARYATANRVALRFARQLRPHVRRGAIAEFRTALRRFWNASMTEKRLLVA